MARPLRQAQRVRHRVRRLPLAKKIIRALSPRPKFLAVGRKKSLMGKVTEKAQYLRPRRDAGAPSGTPSPGNE